MCVYACPGYYLSSPFLLLIWHMRWCMIIIPTQGRSDQKEHNMFKAGQSCIKRPSSQTKQQKDDSEANTLQAYLWPWAFPDSTYNGWTHPESCDIEKWISCSHGPWPSSRLLLHTEAVVLFFQQRFFFGLCRLCLLLETWEFTHQVGISEHEHITFYRASKKASRILCLLSVSINSGYLLL